MIGPRGRLRRRLGIGGEHLRLLIRRRVVVSPGRLLAGALLGDALDAVADPRPGIHRHRVLHGPFVVVDEQARRREVGGVPDLGTVELDRPRDCIARAAADPALVVGREGNLRTQIDRWRQLVQVLHRRRIDEIAMVRKVRHPTQSEADS